MDRVVMWAPQRWAGCEHTAVHATDSGVEVDGLVLLHDEAPVRLQYRLTCDAGWATRRLELVLWDGPRTTLVRSPDGDWSDDAGARPDLAGCVDVDISVTPFTNTLPIRRLSLATGEAHDLRMVYVDVGADLAVDTSEQRYTHLGAADDGARYRYESGSFRADLLVDADGIVLDYPGLWRRVS